MPRSDLAGDINANKKKEVRPFYFFYLMTYWCNCFNFA